MTRFSPDTQLRWSWKVESLPSARAEDSLCLPSLPECLWPWPGVGHGAGLVSGLNWFLEHWLIGLQAGAEERLAPQTKCRDMVMQLLRALQHLPSVPELAGGVLASDPTRAVLRWTWSAEFRPNARFSRREEEKPET